MRTHDGLGKLKDRTKMEDCQGAWKNASARTRREKEKRMGVRCVPKRKEVSEARSISRYRLS